jgi:hypothetical protein
MMNEKEESTNGAKIGEAKSDKMINYIVYKSKQVLCSRNSPPFQIEVGLQNVQGV